MKQARFASERGEWVHVPADRQIAFEQILVPLLCRRCKTRIGKIHLRPVWDKAPGEWPMAAMLEPGYRVDNKSRWRPTRDALRRYHETGQLQPRRYGQHVRDIMEGRKPHGPAPNSVEDWPFIVECHACGWEQKIGAALISKLVLHVWSSLLVVVSPQT
jgi:hypothetical protein